MRRRLTAISILAPMLAGTSLWLASSSAIAEGGASRAQTSAIDASLEGGVKGGRPASSSARTPPDPPAMNERKQWVFDLRWDRGEVFLVGVHKTDMGGPHPTPRMMGRFALELYEGPTLIERVRFDFPMLGGAPEADGGARSSPPRFEPKLKTRIGVLFPATPRGTRLELWDRARDERWPLPWPPTEGPMSSPAPSRDGGS